MSYHTMLQEGGNRSDLFRCVEELFAACRGHGAPLDLRAYNEACGIKREVRLVNFLGDGQLRWLPEEQTYEIVLNSGLPRQFMRFVWAHEIAHAILMRRATRREGTRQPEQGVGERPFSTDPTEILCDKLAAQLLIPDVLLHSFSQGSFPSLRVASEISRSLDVMLKTAAIRLVGSTRSRSWLIIWEVKVASPNNRRLAPYMVYKAVTAKWSDRIPDLVDPSSPPFAAHLTGRLRAGCWRIDLGVGVHDYYVEAMPSRIGSRSAVISMVHFEMPNEVRAQGTLF